MPLTSGPRRQAAEIQLFGLVHQDGPMHATVQRASRCLVTCRKGQTLHAREAKQVPEKEESSEDKPRGPGGDVQQLGGGSGQPAIKRRETNLWGRVVRGVRTRGPCRLVPVRYDLTAGPLRPAGSTSTSCTDVRQAMDTAHPRAACGSATDPVA